MAIVIPLSLSSLRKPFLSLALGFAAVRDMALLVTGDPSIFYEVAVFGIDWLLAVSVR